MRTQFNADWFSHNIPRFGKHLRHLRDTPCRALEIGTHEGRATTWLLQNILTHRHARIDCVDIVVQDNLWDNIKAAGGLQKVMLYRAPSAEALRLLPLGAFDFVYVDGSHSTLNVIEDAVLSFRLAKAGAVISFDDYRWNDPDFNQNGTPKPAVDFFLQVYRPKIEVLEHGYQVWVRKLSD
jgi:predicted O-methyltransferase YrrM